MDESRELETRFSNPSRFFAIASEAIITQMGFVLQIHTKQLLNNGREKHQKVHGGREYGVMYVEK